MLANSDKPGVHYKNVVTIETKDDITSGYVVVQFSGRYAAMWADLANSKLVVNGADVIENSELVKLLQWNPEMPIFVLKIGKTPFLISRPIHVVAEGGTQVHVSKVLYFDE